jgi:hypothetical protein
MLLRLALWKSAFSTWVMVLAFQLSLVLVLLTAEVVHVTAVEK